MKLSAIRLRNVKTFGPEGVAINGIPDGVSLLAQANEFGKSTLFEAVRCLVQEKHTAASKRVQALQSWRHAGPPEIEIDLQTRDGGFRVTKRYLQRKTASVLNLDTGNEVAKGSAADDWLTAAMGVTPNGIGPMGLLWVEQGRSMHQPEGGEAVLSGLLEQEVGRLVGGERARAYLKRAQEDLAALVTVKQGKPTGAYRDAIAAHTEASGTLKALEADKAAADQAVERVIAVNGEIAHLSDPALEAEQQKKKAAADAALEAARHVDSRLKLLAAERDNAAQASKKTIEDHVQWETLVAGAERLSRDIGEIERALSEQAEACEAAESELRLAREDLETAEQALKDADDSNRKCLQFERAAAAAVTLSTLEGDLEEARRLNDEFRTRKQAIQGNLLTQDRYQVLVDLAKRIDLARAKLEIGRPSIVFDLKTSESLEVAFNGVPAVSRKRQTLSGVNVIALGSAGTITITASDPEDMARALEDAEVAFEAALAPFGAADLETAEAKARERVDLQHAQDESRRQLERLAPEGLAALESEVAKQKAELPDDFDPAAAPPPWRDTQSLEEQRTIARAKVDKLRDCLGELQRARAERGAEQVALNRELALLNARLGPEDQRHETGKALEAAIAAAAMTLEQAEASLAALECEAPNLEAAVAKAKRFGDVIAARQKTLSDCKVEQARLQEEIKGKGAAGIGERLERTRGEVAVLEARIEAFERDTRALGCLIGALRDAQDALQDAYFQPVSDELEPLLGEVVGRGTLRLGANFQADSLRRGDRNESVSTLSGGTREQIAVLSRLAFGRLMAKRGTPAPVFLDDALVYCDDDRFDAMLTAIKVAATDVQCIILTCHKGAFENLGAPPLVPGPWLTP
ncbi:MAG: hypothetical protein AAFY85_00515 [Pseudomonadota bacterium]